MRLSNIKKIIDLIFQLNSNNKDIEIDLIYQNIMLLLQIIILYLKI